MANNTNHTPIGSAWLDFVASVQSLLSVQVDDRPLDQYLVFRDAVLKRVQSETFLAELNTTWENIKDSSISEDGNMLLLELQAFSRAVEVARAIGRPEDAKKSWKQLLGHASTVSGSVKDVIASLPAEAKIALTLLGELIAIFKGSD